MFTKYSQYIEYIIIGLVTLRADIFNCFTSVHSYVSILHVLYILFYDGMPSSKQTITYGLPQGYFLGPLLFIIYMINIFNVSELLFSILYADDTIY